MRRLPSRPDYHELRRNALLLLGALFILWLGMAFLEFADDVGEGETHQADMAVLLFLREDGNPADPVGPHWLESSVRDVTALGSVTVLVMVTLAACGFLAFRGQKSGLLVLLVSMAGGLAMSFTLKGIFERPRPDLVPMEAYVGWSFPSGHSMMAAVVYLTLGLILTQFVKAFYFKVYILAMAGLLTFLVGISRIYLGMHYPSDVLAGWMAGLAWAGLCLLVAEWLQQRGTVEDEK